MTILYVGLDVHKATIAVAVAEEGHGGEVRSCGTIDNTPASIDKKMKRLGKNGQELQFCYEAGCCGYPCRRLLSGVTFSRMIGISVMALAFGMIAV